MKVLIRFVVCAAAAVSAANAIDITPGTNIDSVLNAHAAGTTFVLKAGVHRMQAITALQSGDILIGERSPTTNEISTLVTGARDLTPGTVTWTQCTGGACGGAGNDGKWYTTGQTQEGGRWDGSLDYDYDNNGIEDGFLDASVPWCIGNATRCFRPEDLFRDSVLLEHKLSLADVNSTGEWYFDYAADRIYMFDAPAGFRMETSVTQYALVSAGAINVTIRDIIFERYASPFSAAAFCRQNGYCGSGWTVEDVEVRESHGGGFFLSTNMTARRIFVHHSGQMGIGGQTSGWQVLDSEISYSNTLWANYDWEAGGSKFVNSSNTRLENTRWHHNNGTGIWYDIDNDNATIINNQIYDNYNFGLHYELSFGPLLFSGNTVERNGAARPAGQRNVFQAGAVIMANSGILASRPADRLIIENNTLRDNIHGLMAIEVFRSCGGGSQLYPGNWWDTDYAIFQNNTVIQTGGLLAGVLSYEITCENSPGICSGQPSITCSGTTVYITSPMQNMTWTGNEYQTDDTSATRFLFAAGGIGGGNPSYTFAQWTAAGFDAASTIGPITSTTPIQPLPPGVTALSDREPTFAQNFWGPYEKDMSNGEQAGGDGTTITIDGTGYAKGLGTHAPSELRYAVGGVCTSFTATAGVDDEITAGGSVVFQVWADGTQLFTSGTVTSASAAQAVNVDITGKLELRLIATDAGDGQAADHASWGNAGITCGGGAPGGRRPVRSRLNPRFGENLASAATITPTHSHHIITGSVLINSVASTNALIGDVLFLVADPAGSGFTLSAAGNVRNQTIVSAGNTAMLLYDGAEWSPVR